MNKSSKRCSGLAVENKKEEKCPRCRSEFELMHNTVVSSLCAVFPTQFLYFSVFFLN